MKKLLSISILSLFSWVLAGQNTGKWVMPLTDNYTNSLTNKTLEVLFPSTGNITYNILPYSREYEYIGAYGGAYNPNFSELKFFILGDKLYHNGTTTTWITSNAYNKSFTSSFRIIPLNSQGTRFYIIYGDETTPAHNHLLIGQTAELINGIWVFGNPIELANMANPWTQPVHDYLFASFTVTPDNQGTYKLFACYGIEDLTSYELVGYNIDSNGVNPLSRTVYSSSGGLFPDLAYCSWQLSHKTNITSGTETFAWCSSSGWNALYSNLLNHLYILDGSAQREFVMNYGPITGVAFSKVDPSIVYIACEGTGSNYTGRGIYKVNYTTGAVLGMLSGSGEYNRTWLKKAPDGHIYAVRNDGRALGRINQQSGNFEADIFTFPDNMKLNSYYDIITTGGVTHKLFYLPDDNRPLSTLTATFTTTYTSPCQNTGTATVAATGGTAPYTYQWYYLDNGQPVLMPGYTTASVTNLAVGTYQCVVTDAYGYTVTVTLVITYDPNVVVSGMNYISGGTHTNETKIFEQGFIVKAGTTVTLNNCNYQFMPGAKVIVEQGIVSDSNVITSGGLLTLNGTTFTSVQPCNEFWQGVEVWGRKNFSQYMDIGKFAQGRIIINNSLIENARCAVDLRNPLDTISTGGIVMAENSIFRNNRNSLHAMNYIYTFGGNSLDNRSVFRNCTFEIVQGYLYHNPQTDQFYKHVDLCEVKGFRFIGCDFSVANIPGVSMWNHGIAAYNAGLKVEPRCISTSTTCTSYDRSTFTGFSRGITILGSLSNLYGLYVNMADFINVGTGIYLHSLLNATVIQSNFYLKPNIADDSMCISGNPYAWGIMARYSKFLTFEENTISRSASYPTNFNCAGIGIINCKTDDIIYKNTLNNLSIGNYSYGINRTNKWDDREGITYQCNLNNSNLYSDFIVTDSKGCIRGTIGSNQLASGNTFSSSVSWHFRNEGTQDINYYHYGLTNQFPRKVFTLVPGFYFYKINVNTPNTCPSNFNGNGAIPTLGPVDRLLLEQQYQVYVDSYASLNAYYESLIDGGSTEFTLSEIISALPEQTWELVSSLLAKSPYLSTAVLIEAANRQDVIPQSLLFEILAANPEQLRNDTLMNHLESMTNPLPVYMMDVLRSIASGNSARSALLSEMDDYRLKISGTIKTLVNTMLLDTITDNAYIRYWLAKKEDIESAKLIAASYFSENQPDSAFAILNEIPYSYPMDNKELADFENLVNLTNMLQQIKSQNIPFDSIDSTQYQYLTELSANGGEAGAMARSFLEYAFGQRDCHCVADTGSVPLKKSARLKMPRTTQTNTLIANPNPATQWVEFEYVLGGNAVNGTIQITDEAGIKIRTLSVAGNKGKVTLDLRGIAPGIYFANLIANGSTATLKLIIQ